MFFARLFVWLLITAARGSQKEDEKKYRQDDSGDLHIILAHKVEVKDARSSTPEVKRPLTARPVHCYVGRQPKTRPRHMKLTGLRQRLRAKLMQDIQRDQ
ncbi:MAG: hypothetical protein ABSH17_13520 [Syntrophobacteraceae bacterium]